MKVRKLIFSGILFFVCFILPFQNCSRESFLINKNTFSSSLQNSNETLNLPASQQPLTDQIQTNGSSQYSNGFINGIVKTNFSNFKAGFDSLKGIKVLSDGKILTWGISHPFDAHQLLLMRYLPSGELDRNFGQEGLKLLPGYFDLVFLETGGYFLVGVNATSPSTGISLVLKKMDENDNPVTSFGVNGQIQYTNFPFYSGQYKVKVSPSGEIFFVASVLASDRINKDFMLLKIKENGEADSTFGQNGQVIIDLNNNSDDAPRDFVLQNDGSVIVGGNTIKLTVDRISTVTQTDFALVKLNKMGQLDLGFGNSGKIITEVNNGSLALNKFYSDDEMTSLNILPDGKILAAGSSRHLPCNRPSLVKYLSNGALDTTFANQGIYLDTQCDTSSEDLQHLIVQNDGKIIFVGNHYDLGNGDFKIVRLNSDGSRDASFANNGSLLLDSGNQKSEFSGRLALTNSNDIWLGGTTRKYSYTGDYIVAKIGTNGILDTAIGENGFVITDGSLRSDDIVQTMAVQPDGKKILCGKTQSRLGISAIGIARYLADGRLDTEFAQEGKLILKYGDPSNDNCSSVLIQNDGKIIITGISNYAAKDKVVLFKLNSKGDLDKSFNTNGKLLLNLSKIYGVTFTINGKIKLIGERSQTTAGITQRELILTQYLENGTLDTTFGNSGEVKITSIELNLITICEVLFEKDNSVLLTAFPLPPVNQTLSGFLYNFDSSGNLINSFGVNGKLELPYYSIIGNDKIFNTDRGIYRVVSNLLKGSSNKNYESLHVTLERITNDGKKDLTYGNNGRKELNFQLPSEFSSLLLIEAFSGIHLTNENKLLLTFNSQFTIQSLLLMKLDLEGNQDFNFGQYNGWSFNTIGPATKTSGEPLLINTDTQGSIYINGTTALPFSGRSIDLYENQDFQILRLNSKGELF